MVVLALDLIRHEGGRLDPVQVCHHHRTVHILIDPRQAAGFDDVPGVLAVWNAAECGSHRTGLSPYWRVPPGADTARTDPDMLRASLIRINQEHTGCGVYASATEALMRWLDWVELSARFLQDSVCLVAQAPATTGTGTGTGTGGNGFR